METLANRNNNPGNLRDPATGSFQAFKTPQEGYAALLNDLQGKVSGNTKTGLGPNSTLVDFAKVYAPSTENNTAQYVANLANHLGVAPDTTLSKVDIAKLAEGISKNEGYQGNKVISTPQTTSQTTEPTEQKSEGIGGFIGNVAKSITEPVATLLTRPVQLGKTIANVATAPSQEKLNIQKQRNDYLISVLKDPNASPALKQQVTNEIKSTTQNLIKSDKSSSTNVNLPFYGEIKAPEEPADVIKDIGRGLQTVSLGMGLVGGGAAMGAGSALEGGGGLKQAVLGGTLGAATGGLLKGTGKLLGKLTEYLPERIARGFLPGINKETAQYAVNKGLGSPAKMLQESDSSIDSLVSDLSRKLSTSTTKVTANDILPKVVEKFPNAGLTPETIAQKLMQVAPNQKTIIEKLASGGELTLEELHQLNSNIGRNTFKMIFDDPTVRAGKDIASSFYHSASNIIKNKVPETSSLFSQLSKEYPLNTALQKLIRSGAKAKLLTLKDILFLMGGTAAGGPLGMAGAYATSRALSSPTVNLTAAGALKSAGKLGQNKILQSGVGLGSLLTSKGLGGLSNKIIPPPSY